MSDGVKVTTTADGVVVERYFGVRYKDGTYHTGNRLSLDPADAISVPLWQAWPLENVVLITRTTTPGTPTLEAVPLREGDVLQGPYVVLLDGGYYRNTSRDAGPLAEAFQCGYPENAIAIAGRLGGTVHRLLTRPGAPVVTYTVQPLAEAVGVTP